MGIVFNDLKFDGRVLRSNCAFTIEPIFYSVEVHLKTKPWHVAFNEKEAEDDTIISLLKQLPAKCRSKYCRMCSLIVSCSITTLTISSASTSQRGLQIELTHW